MASASNQTPRLSRVFDSNSVLPEIASPILERLYSFLGEYRFVIVLTDSNNQIISISGDTELRRIAAKYNFNINQDIADNKLFSFNKPTEQYSRDHLIFRAKTWTATQSNIYVQRRKKIGAIHLIGKFETVRKHIWALVDSAIMAIQNKLSSELLLHKLHDNKQFIYAITNSLEFGVFAMDLQGNIQFVNDAACRRVNIRRRDLLNTSIADILINWKSIIKQIKEGRKLYNEELEFHHLSNKFVFNCLPILDVDGSGELLGVVLSFRAMQRVINLVNKYTGMQARYTFDDMVAQSSNMSELIGYARTIADSPSTILLMGESGTGKEVIAQSIHNASRRSEYGFVAINCGALSESLIESELFGYDPGAFTGAKKSGHPGKFELANKGTLFLDEIGEMPMGMQVRLLRALQEGTITRLGGEKEIPVDVRIIAATNKNLQEEVDKGNFRLDLFFRLNVIPLTIPALRRREEDIIPLFRYFLSAKAVRLEKNIPTITPEIHNKLISYEWPGNIRELENFAEKFINLNGQVHFDRKEPKKRTIVSSPAQEDAIKLEGTMQEIEKQVIIQRIHALNRNMSKVAKSLGISRNTLYLKLKRYQIDL